MREKKESGFEIKRKKTSSGHSGNIEYMAEILKEAMELFMNNDLETSLKTIFSAEKEMWKNDTDAMLVLFHIYLNKKTPDIENALYYARRYLEMSIGDNKKHYFSSRVLQKQNPEPEYLFNTMEAILHLGNPGNIEKMFLMKIASRTDVYETCAVSMAYAGFLAFELGDFSKATLFLTRLIKDELKKIRKTGRRDDSIHLPIIKRIPVIMAISLLKKGDVKAAENFINIIRAQNAAESMQNLFQDEDVEEYEDNNSDGNEHGNEQLFLANKIIFQDMQGKGVLIQSCPKFDRFDIACMPDVLDSNISDTELLKEFFCNKTEFNNNNDVVVILNSLSEFNENSRYIDSSDNRLQKYDCEPMGDNSIVVKNPTEEVNNKFDNPVVFPSIVFTPDGSFHKIILLD